MGRTFASASTDKAEATVDMSATLEVYTRASASAQRPAADQLGSRSPENRSLAYSPSPKCHSQQDRTVPSTPKNSSF
jgi:hypothetical protein